MTIGEFPKPLVAIDWLAAHIGAPDLKLIDGSWRMPGKGDAQADYSNRHIPGAAFFPIDDIADRSTDLPHMLPAPAQFEAAAGGLGICDLDRVVVYDDQGLFSAARVWWTFKAMGHREIAVLDGGLPAWIDAGGAVTHEATAVAAAAYRAKPEPSLVASHAQVRRALAERSSLVLDARPSGRFLGRDREPRPGLKSGAMPGAASLPYSALITADGRLKSAPELAALFAAAGADGSEAIIATCGSGVSAAILSLALEALGRTPARLYDGAWAEWGRIANDPARFPVTTGDR